jgi:hypothetical protein
MKSIFAPDNASMRSDAELNSLGAVVGADEEAGL